MLGVGAVFYVGFWVNQQMLGAYYSWCEDGDGPGDDDRIDLDEWEREAAEMDCHRAGSRPQ